MEPRKVASMQDVVVSHLTETLELFGWNKTRTALALDLDRRTVIRMIERYKLKRPGRVPAGERKAAEAVA